MTTAAEAVAGVCGSVKRVVQSAQGAGFLYGALDLPHPEEHCKAPSVGHEALLANGSQAIGTAVNNLL